MDIIIGKNFKRDGSDYDPSAVPPTVDEIMTTLKREKIKAKEPFVIVALGIFYPGGKPTGISRVIKQSAIQTASRRAYAKGGFNDVFDPDKTAELTTVFMNLDAEPVHIFGFRLRSV